MGIIIDEIFIGKCYYRKFAEILGPKSKNYLILDNYDFKSDKFKELSEILSSMILKDRQQRISLEEAKEKIG